MPISQDVIVSPFYHEAKNEITRPGQFVSCSRYLVEKWMPRLGPLGFGVVIYLRSLGFYNPRTGERRDEIRVSQAAMAAHLGVSVDTLQREMRRNAALSSFVRCQEQSVRSSRGRLRQLDSVYFIAMDDPLVPEDEPLLLEILERRKRSARQAVPGRVEFREEDLAQEGFSETLLSPEPQIAASVEEEPEPQFAASVTLPPEPQFAVRLIDIHGNLDIPKDNNNIPPAEPAGTAVVALLCDAGVTLTVAQELAEAFPVTILRQQIEALPYRDPKEPAAVLVKAIRESWALPAAYVAAQEERERARKREETRQHRAAEREKQEAARRAVENQVEAYWNGLSVEEQEGIRLQAEAQLRRENPFLARRIGQEKPGTVLEATLKSLRQRLLCEWLGITAPVPDV